MFSLIPTLPTFAEISAQTTNYTAGMFTDVISLVGLGVGLVLGGLILGWIGGKVVGAVRSAMGKKRGGRGRRRR